MTIGVKISNQLKELRVQAGLSQSAASTELDIPLRTYQSWEKEFTSSIQNLIKICRFYDFPMEKLLKQLDPKETPVNGALDPEDYKQAIFHMALMGRTVDDIFGWFGSKHPDKAEGILNPGLFIENCILDIYHLNPRVLHQYNFTRADEKERALEKLYGLGENQVIIARSGHISHEVAREMIIAPLGGELLTRWSAEKPGFRMGISNGFTTARILDSIPRGGIRNMILFPMNFTSTQVDFPISSTALISSFLYKSAGYGVSTDTVTEEQVHSSMLLADAALLGIGTFSREGLYERMIRSVLGQSMVTKIREMGIIGDLNYNLFNSGGEEFDLPEVVTRIGNFEGDSLVKSISLDSLKLKAERGGKIIIAGTGKAKAESVSVALSKGYANYLITDETIADELLG